MNNYGIDSIQHLEIREAIRTRVPMYLGSDDTEGIYQALKEIVNNSTDEALAGYGDKIEISLMEEGVVSVRDYGRGVPFGVKDGRNILVAIYTESHTGGKFDKGAYKNSSGLNGIGGTATCMSSSLFEVESYRDGVMAKAIFVEGVLNDYSESHTTEKNGTKVLFKPDRKVFINAEDGFSYDRICSEIKNISYLNNGVKFIVKDEKNKEIKEFYSKNGIADFIVDNVKKPLMKKPIIVSKNDGVDSVEIAFMWTEDIGQSYVFVNGLFCPQNGSPVTGAKAAITTSMRKFMGNGFDPEFIRKGLVYAINCKVANPSFANQTKTKINNPSLRTLASEAFKEGIELFSNTGEFNAIIDMLNRFAMAEKAANKARESMLNTNREIEKETKKKIVLAEKLVDCRIHDENSMIFLTEGKSAKGAIVKARNSNNVACFDLRGKIINALKNDEEKVAANEEVRQIHIALGCGIGEAFNIKKLRYGKIVLVADMDKDGFAINCLLLTFFYKYYPELIKAGKIYWGATPLFKVESKGKRYYAYNEDELKSLPKGDITRLKGLGESMPIDFKETICSDNPRLIQFTMNDVEMANKYFNILLGKDIVARKEYIFANARFDELED